MINGVERDEEHQPAEFEIIARYFAPLAKNPAALALLDDAAILPVPEALELIATCDTIVEGVHFLPEDPPDSIAHKALAVTLSDLAAKGGRPHAYLLSLALPGRPEDAWLDSFASGLKALQGEVGIDLIGGDTTGTPGPLTITVTALGLISQGEAILRRGALAGDTLLVSGTIGDAFLGLKLLRNPELAAAWGLSSDEAAFLIERYRRPAPRVGLSLSVRHCARAAIDISDGLVGDCRKLCRASGVGASVEAARVPLSEAAAKAVSAAPGLLSEMLSAGDDYEILAAMEEAHCKAFFERAAEHGIAVTPIGTVRRGSGEVEILDAAGQPLPLPSRGGFEHFGAPPPKV
jgi:thiamine-monophosphate kinase